MSGKWLIETNKYPQKNLLSDKLIPLTSKSSKINRLGLDFSPEKLPTTYFWCLVISVLGGKNLSRF